MFLFLHLKSDLFYLVSLTFITVTGIISRSLGVSRHSGVGNMKSV
jgi:hypothetical protein